jgi:hypothetical protein
MKQPDTEGGENILSYSASFNSYVASYLIAVVGRNVLKRDYWELVTDGNYIDAHHFL